MLITISVSYGKAYAFGSRRAALKYLDGLLHSENLVEGFTVNIGTSDRTHWMWENMSYSDRNDYPNEEWFRIGIKKLDFQRDVDGKYKRYAKKATDSGRPARSFDEWLKVTGKAEEYYKLPTVSVEPGRVKEPDLVDTTGIEFGEAST